jgi:V8-like Glu-specific endopeptidase
LPVNFLSDLDTTGGNSGSPVLNAMGDPVGLNVDGNWEADQRQPDVRPAPPARDPRRHALAD